MRPSLLSAVALTIVALYALPAAAQDNQDQDTAEVEFEDQTMDGDTVVVARVVLPEGGFVTIHDDSLLDGDAAGSVVGTSDYLEAGEHTDVNVTIDTSMMNNTGDGQTTGTNDQMQGNEITLIAMPHMDTNGNEEYDFVTSDGADDGPYSQNGGGAVTAEAQVTMQQQGDGGFGNDGGDGLDDPGDDGFPDDSGDDGAVDEEGDDTPGFEAVALLALLGAIAVLRRR